MSEEKPKKFEPFPTRPIRLSDKQWETLRQNKLLSGLSWDKYIQYVNKNIDKPIKVK